MGAGIWARLGFLVPVVLFVPVAARYVLQNPLETDEGFYAAAARAAVSGLVPYRDFPFNQTHVYPYLHGALIWVGGFGLLIHRAVSALYVLGGIVVIARGRTFGHVFAATALVASAHFVARSVLGQSFPMAALFLLLAAVAFLKGRVWALALFGALAIGAKLTVLPAVAILWGVQFWRDRRPLSAAAPVAALVLLFAPVVLADPKAWWFWNVGYHLGLEAIDFRSASAYRDHLVMAPAVLALTLVALWVSMQSEDRARLRSAYAVVAAGAFAWIIQLPLRSTQGEYAVLFLPVAALGAAELLRGVAWRPRQRVLVMLALITSLFPDPPERDPRVHEELRAASDALRASVPPSQQVLTPVPIVALQSGHPLVRGCEMGPFNVTEELSEERAARLHLLTPARLVALSEDPMVGAVVLTGQPSTWDFYWSVPSLREVSAAARATYFGAIAEEAFHPVLKNRDFTVLVRQPEKGLGPPFWQSGAADQ